MGGDGWEGAGQLTQTTERGEGHGVEREARVIPGVNGWIRVD